MAGVVRRRRSSHRWHLSSLAARPLGGALFGWVGDKFGRKQALLWSVMAMAFPSFFIGVLPSAETIGIAAPILLLACRLMQGLAVGGE